MRAIFDTCILIDYLKGEDESRIEMAKYREIGLSIVTWMEILIGARDDAEEKGLRRFLSGFQIHPITTAIADEAIRIRRDRRIKLPDAIVWATAKTLGGLLVTRNTEDFPADDPFVRVPYRL